MNPVDPVNPFEARTLETMAARQFGKQVAQFLHENRDRLAIERSKNTGKIRYVYLDGALVLVLRPEEGFFSLSIAGAIIVNELEMERPINGIMVPDDVAEFIKDGKNVFAKHVLDPWPGIRPAQELYVCDEQRNVVGVGKAILSGNDMRFFKRGMAVKVRHGINDGQLEQE